MDINVYYTEQGSLMSYSVHLSSLNELNKFLRKLDRSGGYFSARVDIQKR